MAQFARPTSDVTNTGLTGGFASIDESTPSDADWWGGDNNQADTLEVALGSLTDPTSSSGHVFRYRVAKSDSDGSTPDGAGSSVTITASIWQGGTQIAADAERTLTGTWTEYAYTLSGAEADAITNYTDLRLRFVTSASGGNPSSRRAGAVSWAEFEVPDASSDFSGSAALSHGHTAAAGGARGSGGAAAASVAAGASAAGSRGASAVASVVATHDIAPAGFDSGPSDTYGAAVWADSPLAFFRLGEASGTTAIDEVGAHDGSYVGTPTLGGAGIAGTSVALDGTGAQYVSTDWSVIPGPPISLECWVRFDGAYADASLGGWISEPGVLGCQLYLSGGTNVRIGVEQGNANANCTGILDGNWHHIVGTIDGSGDARLYYDGVLVAGPTAVTFGGGASAHPFWIGRTFFTTGVNGALDEWAVYDTALSGVRVADHYVAGAGSPARTGSASVTAGHTTSASAAGGRSGSTATSAASAASAATASARAGSAAVGLTGSVAATGAKAAPGSIATSGVSAAAVAGQSGRTGAAPAASVVSATSAVGGAEEARSGTAATTAASSAQAAGQSARSGSGSVSAAAIAAAVGQQDVGLAGAASLSAASGSSATGRKGSAVSVASGAAGGTSAAGFRGARATISADLVASLVAAATTGRLGIAAPAVVSGATATGASSSRSSQQIFTARTRGTTNPRSSGSVEPRTR